MNWDPALAVSGLVAPGRFFDCDLLWQNKKNKRT